MDITACREGLMATPEKNRVHIKGEGYEFNVSADPSGSAYCSCSDGKGRLQVADLGYVRLYGCETCGARVSLWTGETPATIEVKGVNAEEVSRVLTYFFGKVWDEVQEYDLGSVDRTIEDFGGEVDRVKTKSEAVRMLMIYVCRVKELNDDDRHELMKALVDIVAGGRGTGGAIKCFRRFLPILGQILNRITPILTPLVSPTISAQLGI